MTRCEPAAGEAGGLRAPVEHGQGVQRHLDLLRVGGRLLLQQRLGLQHLLGQDLRRHALR